MSERKLAHIEKIIDLNPIPGADKIEVATVLGWQCVVKKGEFKVGDWCIYIEIDSVLPAENPYWEFMASRKYRVKTIKLRGQISQGLVIPLIKETIEKLNINFLNLEEGEDVTDNLKIKKWLSPSERDAEYSVPNPKKKHNWFIKFMTRFSWYRKLTHTKSKSFPEWISKTDEERLQNCPWVLTKHKDDNFYVTEKLDGQSSTYWYKRKIFKSEFGICSRTVRKFEWDGSNWSKVAKKYDLKNKLKQLGFNVAIQGEIIGPGIQSNKYNLNDYKLYLFNVFDIDKKKYLPLTDAAKIAKILNINFVPVINDDFKLLSTVPEMIELAKGKSILYDVLREGIVLRKHDKSISFKCINPEFLLKYEE